MSEPAAFRRRLRRALLSPLLVLAAVVVLFEELFWDQLQTVAARLARWAPLARLEAWVAARDRWTLLALFAVPVAALFPVKLAALWLIGSGHVAGGLGVLVGAKLAGTAYAARLFLIGRDKLLSIRWFARCYDFATWVHRLVHTGFERTGVPALARRVRAAFRRWRATAGQGSFARRVHLVKRRLAGRG
ncbi:hypothetical protein [Azospirillum sp. TSO22-1]|uniref:hypothetical protein n=1 Tax=Azospirillum sp. TSO22-1 TaxID=716789 RepID=UPI000D61B290|nr:hypothetical protein [Azospirillum sp. TSO22-1]PWC42830.1 hypothetical protein TSO221_21120 [Azospirillum sp. TSO22-1]